MGLQSEHAPQGTMACAAVEIQHDGWEAVAL